MTTDALCDNDEPIAITVPAESELTADELSRLDRLETTVRDGLKSFVDIGKAFTEICESKLYRASHDSFESYCRDKWGFSRQHAYRLINATALRIGLSPTGDILPENESQCRPLAKLLDADQQVAWQKVVERAPQRPDGTKEVTTKLVKEVVNEMLRTEDEPPDTVTIGPNVESAGAVPDPVDADIVITEHEPTDTSHPETPPDASADETSEVSTAAESEPTCEPESPTLVEQCEALLEMAKSLRTVSDDHPGDQVEDRKREILSQTKDAALAIADTISEHDAVICQLGDSQAMQV